MLRPVVHALPSTFQTECDVAMMKRYGAAPVAVMHALPSTLQTECNVAMMKRYGAAPVMHALAPTLHAQSECCSDMHASYTACLQADCTVAVPPHMRAHTLTHSLTHSLSLSLSLYIVLMITDASEEKIMASDHWRPSKIHAPVTNICIYLPFLCILISRFIPQVICAVHTHM